MCAASVSVHGDRAVAFPLRRSHQFTRSQVFQTINKEIGVSVAEYQRTEFHDTDESAQIQDFCVGISAIENA